MSNCVIVSLPNGAWLELTQEAFEAALAAGAARMPNTRAGGASATDTTETLLDAQELAEALKVPPSRIEDLARQKRIPCLRVGRYVRFSRRAVEAALSSNGHG